MSAWGTRDERWILGRRLPRERRRPRKRLSRRDLLLVALAIGAAVALLGLTVGLMSDGAAELRPLLSLTDGSAAEICTRISHRGGLTTAGFAADGGAKALCTT